MLVGTGGTTGRPKGVRLTGRNVETMSALTLMSYPFEGRPVYLALAPLTHAAGVLCFPVMALGGEIVVMPAPDLGEFLALIERHRVTHTFLPPTLIYMLLAHPALDATDLSLAAVPLVRRGADLGRPAGGGDHPDRPGDGPAVRAVGGADDGVDAGARRPSAAGRVDRAGAAVLGRAADAAGDGGDHVAGRRSCCRRGERGEVVVRGSLVMAGYHKDPAATAEASRFGWHHTGDIGYLDDDNFLYLVDRAKDMIISGGFNVYSAEVERALMAHPGVQDCAVIGLPDEKWGERVVAVLQPQARRRAGRPPRCRRSSRSGSAA